MVLVDFSSLGTCHLCCGGGLQTKLGRRKQNNVYSLLDNYNSKTKTLLAAYEKVLFMLLKNIFFVGLYNFHTPLFTSIPFRTEEQQMIGKLLNDVLERLSYTEFSCTLFFPIVCSGQNFNLKSSYLFTTANPLNNSGLITIFEFLANCNLKT